MYKVNWKLCRFHQFLLTVIFLFWNWSVHILCVCACVTMLQHLQVFLSFFIVIAIIGHVYRRKLWLFARACVSFVCAKWNGNFTCQHICCLAAYMHVKMYKDIVNWNIDCVGIDSGAYVLDRSFSASTSIFLIWNINFWLKLRELWLLSYNGISLFQLLLLQGIILFNVQCFHVYVMGHYLLA